MAWLAVHRNGVEVMSNARPYRDKNRQWWNIDYKNNRLNGVVDLPKGSIKKLIGRNLTYDDEPVELKNDISSYRNK